jgi:hypothetical protein
MRMPKAVKAMGRKTAFTAMNFAAQFVGFTKLDTFPGGGGSAGTRSEDMIGTSDWRLPPLG